MDNPTGRSGSTPAVADKGKIYIKQVENVVSTNEPYYGGEIRPVELLSFNLTPSEDTNGLEDFLAAIRHIASSYSQPSIRCSVFEIPGDRAFCHLPDGSKRNCAVVEINQDGILPSFILEVARPDRWFISTLFIQIQAIHNIAPSIEQEITNLLEDTVKRDGHWNIEKLGQSPTLKTLRLKHISAQSPWIWSQRILGRLSGLGFVPR
jgi:hypothetical protein